MQTSNINIPIQMFSVYDNRIKELVTLCRLKLHFNSGDFGKRIILNRLAKLIGVPRNTLRNHLIWLESVGLMHIIDGKYKHINFVKHLKNLGIDACSDIVYSFSKFDFEKTNHEISERIKAERIAYFVRVQYDKKQSQNKSPNWRKSKGTGSSVETMDDLGLSMRTDGVALSATMAGTLLNRSIASGHRAKCAAKKLGLLKINNRKEFISKTGEIKSGAYNNLSDNDRVCLDEYYSKRNFHLVKTSKGTLKVFEDWCYPTNQSLSNNLSIRLSVSLMMKLKLEYRKDKMDNVKSKISNGK